LAASKQVAAALAVYEVSELAVAEEYLRIAGEADRASLAVLAIISTEFPCYPTSMELKKSHPEYVEKCSHDFPFENGSSSTLTQTIFNHLGHL
jgi:hypothetical protein